MKRALLAVVILTITAPAAVIADGMVAAGVFAMDCEGSDYAAPSLFVRQGNVWAYVEDEDGFTELDLGYRHESATYLIRAEWIGTDKPRFRPGIKYHHHSSGAAVRLYAGTGPASWMLDIYPPSVALGTDDLRLSGDFRLFEGGHWNGWLGACLGQAVTFHTNLNPNAASRWQVVVDIPLVTWE